MDFELSDEQNAIVETTRQFAHEKLAPGYRDRDRDGSFPRELWSEMGTLGLIGCELPESLGGLGLEFLTAGLVQEALAEGDLNFAVMALLNSLNGQIIADSAAPDVARDWIAKICSGETMFALGLTEPSGGSDVAHLRLRARRDGDCFVLDGEKTSISAADHADAAVIFARTGGDGAGGISAFIVDLNQDGIERTRFDDHGWRAVARGSIHFDGARIPAGNLLGGENTGFRQVMQGFDYSRALIGLHCVAVARQSLAESWAYAREREAFGRPIADNQGVTFPLAEGETMIEAARLLCLKTLWLKDNKLPHTTEAAMCKWWAPKVSGDVIRTCLLTHGHGGYSSDMPYEQRMRDVFGYEIGDGTAQIMKLIISRQKLGRRV
ncbi:MAG: acyl-CoA dehydrogenase family protein [Hyphomicrobiales bacterium]